MIDNQVIANMLWILDMGRTLTNVTFDAVTACIVDKNINGKVSGRPED